MAASGLLLPGTANCRTDLSRREIMPCAHKKPASSKREYKTQRLELRLAPSAKKVIQQAMSVTGLAAGDLPKNPNPRYRSPWGRESVLGKPVNSPERTLVTWLIIPAMLLLLSLSVVSTQ